MRFIQTFLCATLCLTAAFSAVLTAQDSTGFQDSKESYPKVRAIEIEFKSFKSVSDQFVLSNIQLRAGMNYNPALVDQSIRTLYGTGYFEFVEVRVDIAEDKTVDVVFELISKYTIETINYSGNEKYSDDRMAKASKGDSNGQAPEVLVIAGVSLDEYKVSVAADNIQAYYVKKGYPDVTVDYRIQRAEDTGFATVVFDVDEGTRVKIDEINFKGNQSFSDRKLSKELETKQANWLSWITGSGKFDEAKFKEDLELLRTFYRNKGYLDVLIDEDLVDIVFKTPGKMLITVQLVEGLGYTLGEMSIENATIFTKDELISSVKVDSGDAFSPKEIDEAATAIREYYTSRGYLDAGVRAERVPNMDTNRIDVVFRVRESEKFYVESIKIEGNTTTKSRVIIRELALRPGDVFDLQRMDTSKRRLQNTRFFNNVNLTPETTNVPGRRDLGVTVSEGRTGNFSFGAGFGSVESAVVFVELTQGNFDLFNWRSGFQGDGQKFRFRASFGTNSSQIVIAFEEPWLFEQRLAFGVELFRSQSDYNSSDYNELRTGFEIYLRRRLFELVEARLSYRLELVEIFDVDFNPGLGTTQNPDGSLGGDGVADVFQAAVGEDIVSKVGLTFLRDTRDSLIFTRKGNRTTIGTEFAGLGGDVNYFKMEAKTAHFIPTFDTLEQTLSIVSRLGSVAAYGNSGDVPFYDRFYLGGPDSLRGFEHRDVGPRDPDDIDESVGGNSYGMISFEYQFRIAEPLGLVVFYDWGFVNTGEYDFSPSDYADNWGVGARILLMGSPLKLDLGIPITSPENAGDGTQFNFSFGTRF